jgi:hypothetical protein
MEQDCAYLIYLFRSLFEFLWIWSPRIKMHDFCGKGLVFMVAQIHYRFSTSLSLPSFVAKVIQYFVNVRNTRLRSSFGAHIKQHVLSANYHPVIRGGRVCHGYLPPQKGIYSPLLRLALASKVKWTITAGMSHIIF